MWHVNKRAYRHSLLIERGIIYISTKIAKMRKMKSREGSAAAMPKKAARMSSVAEIIKKVTTDNGDNKVIEELDESGYLYEILWPQIIKKPKTLSSTDSALLFALLVNQATLQKNDSCPLAFIIDDEKGLSKVAFQNTLHALLSHDLEKKWELEAQRVLFLTNAFQSLDAGRAVSDCMIQLVGAQLWECMSPRRRELEFALNPSLEKIWNRHRVEQSSASSASAGGEPKSKKAKILQQGKHSHTYMADLLNRFLYLVSVTAVDIYSPGQLHFLHRTLELLIDLLSCLPTRRWIRGLCLDYNFTVKSMLSPLGKDTQEHGRVGKLFRQQLEMLIEMENFSTESTATYKNDVDETHVHTLQKICFKLFPSKLEEFVYAGVEAASKREFLIQELGKLDEDELQTLCYTLRLIDNERTNDVDRDYLLSLLTYRYASRLSELKSLAQLPIFPSEELLWDVNKIPPEQQTPSSVLALPKLNLQFLTTYDYLLRNFKLYRLESAHGIRSDLADVAKRVQPALRSDKTVFQGWSRKALEIRDFDIKSIKNPRLGTSIPGAVIATFNYDLKVLSSQLQQEWDDGIREMDAMFLLAFDASAKEVIEAEQPKDDDPAFPKRFGIIGVRGCTVVSVADEKGTILSGSDKAWQETPPRPVGTVRCIQVQIDPAQYAEDMRNGMTHIYDKLNLVVKRDARTNNFHSLLSTLIEILSVPAMQIPAWMQSILLGYGDPKKCKGGKKPDRLDFSDTFINRDHLMQSFPGYEIKIMDSSTQDDNLKRVNYQLKVLETKMKVEAIPYPFPMEFAGNRVRFTPRQVEAIQSGNNPGLTLIVGPPGTGKTDVAVQIIANLYKTNPEHRTLIITHSNAALNDIFAKVMIRGDVPPRYLLRLGSGERSLQTHVYMDESDEAYSKAGRVAHTLQKRNELLSYVQTLSVSLQITKASDNSEYTCESSSYFCLHHVQSRIEIFEKKVKALGSVEETTNIIEIFPFSNYFKLEPTQTVLTLKEARNMFAQLEALFEELKEYRPLELLRTQRQRTNYLLTKQAKVIAMTCTHASMIRSQLMNLKFQYDSVVMEEAGQMLEVETFIPLLLQPGEQSQRLKRLVLIGDHNQLPPVVKNRAFQKYSRFDQSMFSRLIRLGVPAIQLNCQGRARHEIANLYRWRYNDLQDLDFGEVSTTYKSANAGFAHTFQFIDVPDYQGQGESNPAPYVFQNLGEAEYIVAVFQYMVLIGYNPKKISILTTYNGQKNLIQDIIAQRCDASSPLAGVKPGAISTVDQYQGQQNDIILLSFVRTSSLGFMRDVRRFVVATSRARLGLYTFGRLSLFDGCHELKEGMAIFHSKPHKLELVMGEHFGSPRQKNESIPDGKSYRVEDVETLGSIVHSMLQQQISS